MRQRIHILLADDHRLVRAGLRAILEEMPGVRVVAEASSGLEAIDLARRARPDLVLMDITMPGLNGIDATSVLHRDMPDLPVLMLSMHSEDEYVVRSMRAGACGYVIKDAAAGELQKAIRAAIQGKTFMSPDLPTDAIERRLESPPGRDEPLTLRQREILQLLAEGVGVKEAAIRLRISSKTVETHRERIMDRLRIHDLPGLVRYAMSRGIVPT
ncbi:MAG: response regulator transcription factor [Planctomycetota bacterium]